MRWYLMVSIVLKVVLRTQLVRPDKVKTWYRTMKRIVLVKFALWILIHLVRILTQVIRMLMMVPIVLIRLEHVVNIIITYRVMQHTTANVNHVWANML